MFESLERGNGTERYEEEKEVDEGVPDVGGDEAEDVDDDFDT